MLVTSILPLPLEENVVRYLKYTKEQFITAVASSRSIMEALKKLNLVPNGGNYSSFRKRIKNFGLDTSHFTGQGWAKGRAASNKRPINDYLSNKAYITSNKLKLRLIKEGFFKKQCDICKNIKWMDSLIPIELHHKDGNHDNNVLSNLQVLCPNCHAQTSNHRKKK